jgi:hypothetical protein
MGLLKKTPFTLRQAQGEREIIELLYPFVVSLSNHLKQFSNSLLWAQKKQRDMAK